MEKPLYIWCRRASLNRERVDSIKSNPGSFDGYENAHADEPMFVLPGRDPHAPFLVRAWTELK
ncbi:MAG: hypothetical protein ACI9DC_001024 [Gammaproteobacteria bacterium]|jgi:hypothetical protein